MCIPVDGMLNENIGINFGKLRNGEKQSNLRKSNLV